MVNTSRTQSASLPTLAVDRRDSIMRVTSLPEFRLLSSVATGRRPACHSAPTNGGNFVVEDDARGMKRKVSCEESPERAIAKRARGSRSASQDNSLTSCRSEKQKRVMKKPRRSLSSTKETSKLDPSAIFQATYVEEGLLGEGGYGSVYAGHRTWDNLPVAIKHVPLFAIERVPAVVNGQICYLPLEVMLLSMAGAGAPTIGSSAAIALIESFELEYEVIMVMERPIPCTDLFDYIGSNGQFLEEDEAKILMKQLLAAFIELHSKGVLHRDIKPENILVQTGSDGPRLRVIDFGCGTELVPGPYTGQPGTRLYAPPEYFLDNSYEADPLTVWQLGVVLYVMLHGEYPFSDDDEILFKTPTISRELSFECRVFLRCCLAKSTSCRPTLQDLQRRQWLQ